MSQPRTPAPMERSTDTRDTPDILRQLESELRHEKSQLKSHEKGLLEDRELRDHLRLDLARHVERKDELLELYKKEVRYEHDKEDQLQKAEQRVKSLEENVSIIRRKVAGLEWQIEVTPDGARTTNIAGARGPISREPSTAQGGIHRAFRGERDEPSMSRQGSGSPIRSMEDIAAANQDEVSRHNSIEIVGYAPRNGIAKDDSDEENEEDEEEQAEEDHHDDDNTAEEEAEEESEEENGGDDDDEDAERARVDSHHMDGGSRAGTTRPNKAKAKTRSKRKGLASSDTTRSEEQSSEDRRAESSEEEAEDDDDEEDDETANSGRKPTKAEKKAAKEKAEKKSKKAQRKAEQKKAEKRAKRAEKQLRKAAKTAGRAGTAETEEDAANLLSLAGRDTMSAQPEQSPREDGAGSSKQQRKELKKAKTSSIPKSSAGGGEDLTIYDVPGSPTPGPSSLRLASDRRAPPASPLGSAQGLMGPPPRPGTTERTQVPLRTPSSSKKRKAAPDGAVDASKTRRVDGNLGPSSHKQREPRSAALKGRERAKAHATWNGYSSDRQSVALADSEDEMGRFIIQKP